MRAATGRAGTLLAALAALCLAGPAPARAEETPYETVAGYEVARDAKPGDTQPCTMTRAYKDPSDKDAENALFFTLSGDDIVVSLAYERWKWEDGKHFKAALSIDGTQIDPDAQWLGKGVGLAMRQPQSIVPKLRAGKRIVLGFRNGPADFDLAGFGPAFDALLRCNAGQPPSGGVASAAAPPAAPLPSEDRAVAYLFALYDRWAFDACDLPSTAKQRQAVEAGLAALKPEMGAAEPELAKAVQAGGPERCPPAAAFRTQLQLLADNPPDAFLAKVDRKVADEFRGIVRPILARLAPPAAELPNEAEVATYWSGLSLQDAIARCDLPTTGRQRTGLDARVQALRPKMIAVEAAVQKALRRDDPCPEGENRNVIFSTLFKAFVEMEPGAFVAESKRITGFDPRDKAEMILKAVRPAPDPAQARMTTYLWGLLVRDKIAECDIATTAKQRAGLEAKLASLQPEMAAQEAALRASLKGKAEGCPSPDKIAEMSALLGAFVEKSPEDFAEAMNRMTALAKGGAAPKP